ncbi:beta strand repeat-containing protein [Williamsia sp. MIQD14]|uniref:beta strand repeat-containing protein n=1 Tax=Williamsia sp. MIQD14 TaxID=3425703 RepID=UPI003DA00AC6
MAPVSAFAAVGLTLLGLPVAVTNQTTGLPVAPAPVVNPLGDLVAAFFRRIQSVFDPYRTNQNAPTTINPSTGQVTGSAQFTSPFFLPQVYTITAPAGGTASVDKNGQFVYTPTVATRHAASAPGATTTDSFTVTASNWISRSSVVVTVPVLPQNTAPTAGATTVGTPGVNGVVAGSVSVTDRDNDPITYSASTPGKGSVVVSSTGGFVYTPTATARHDAASTSAPTSASSDGFTITASDGHGGATPISVVVSVLPANQAPVAGTTTFDTPDANGVVTGVVSTTDADRDAVTYTAGTGSPSRGTVTVTATGGFTYTPTSTAQHAAAAGGPTSDSFTVTANDGHGGVIPISLVVPIASTNRAPVAGTTTLDPAAPNGFLGGTVTATDPDGDTISFAGPFTSAGGGTVQVSTTGQFIYQPTTVQQHAAAAPGGATTDSFTVTASDGHGGSTPISVVVPIAAANAAPVAGTTTVGAPGVNGVVTGAVTATDADQDTVTYTAGSGSGTIPTRGTVVVSSSGGFTYTPAAGAGASGPTSDTFTVIASDGHGGATPITVVVPIAAIGRPPVAGITIVNSPGANGVVVGSVSAADPDGDPVTFSAPAGGVSTRGGMVVVDGSGNFTYTPTAAARHAASSDQSAPTTWDTFTVTASDGRGGSTPITVTVAVSPANAAPVAGTSSATVVSTVTGQVTGTITATDADGDRLKFRAPSSGLTAGGGSITVSTDGTYSYVPTAAARHAASAPGGVASDSFVATVDDGHGETTNIAVTVPISPTNRAPVVGTTTVNTAGTNGVVSGRVSITDPDGDPLIYTATSAINGGVVVVHTDGTFTYTPGVAAHAAAAGGPTTDAFAITATDGHGGTTPPVTVVVPVTPANQAPVVAPFTNGSTITGVTQATNVVTGTITVTDADGDALTYTASTPARGAVTVAVDGSFTYTPTAAARHDAAATGNFSDTFTVTVTDGHGGSVPVTVVVPVSPINTDPVPGTTTVGIPNPATGVVTGTLTATDADGDTLTWYQNGTPANGSVTINADGTFTYTPTTDARTAAGIGGATTDTITAVVVDGHGSNISVTATVPIAAFPANRSPVAGATTVGTPGSGGVVTGSITATDPDGDPVTFSGPTGTTTNGGTVTISSTGGFAYTPSATAQHSAAGGGPSTDSFSVNAGDGRGGSVAIPVIVAIAPTNTAPTATVRAGSGPIGDVPLFVGTSGTVGFTIVGNDADGDAISYAVPPGGSTRGGTVTPVVGYPGSFVYTPSVLARMSAASSGPTTDTVTVTLTDGHGGSTPVEITVPVAPAGDTTTLPLILTNIGGTQVFVPGQFGTGSSPVVILPPGPIPPPIIVTTTTSTTTVPPGVTTYCSGDGHGGIECMVR